MRSSSALIAVAVAFALAGCGGSSTPAAHTSPASGSQSQATSPTTASTPTTTSSTASTPSVTAPASGPSICRAADLSASFLGGQAATGHGLLGFALHNTSAHTCTTYGYPGIQFLTGSGQPLPTTPTHTTQDYFGALPKHTLTVAPGSTVSFRLGVTHGAASTASCATAYGLQVIPPNDTSTLRISIPNGAYECQTATVSPVQPGSSAYP